jgi:hypothetical protein
MLTPTGEHDSHYPSLHVLNILYIHRCAEAFTNRNRIYRRDVVADTKAKLYTPCRYRHLEFFHRVIQGDQGISVYSNNPHTIDDLKMTITEHIRNVDCPILHTVFENTVRRVNKCLQTGGGHFEHYS